MTKSLLDLLPSETTLAARVEWAGERVWDLAEGKLSKSEGRFVLQALIGWTDLCSKEEKEAYDRMAGEVRSILDTMA